MNDFLEDQAKKRNMTVSEMMAERNSKVKPENRTFSKNKDLASRAAQAKWNKWRENKAKEDLKTKRLGEGAEG